MLQQGEIQRWEPRKSGWLSSNRNDPSGSAGKNVAELHNDIDAHAFHSTTILY